MSSPKMPGHRGITPEEQETIWNLHIKHNLPSTVICKRFGMSQTKVSKFLQQRKRELGIKKVEVDWFRIVRPTL